MAVLIRTQRHANHACSGLFGMFAPIREREHAQYRQLFKSAPFGARPAISPAHFLMNIW